MPSKRQLPVDEIVDVALRDRLVGLGFKHRGGQSRYFELPCEGFNWFVAFGPGPKPLQKTSFTDTTSIFIPELEKILIGIGEQGAGRPLRINRKAHFYGGIETFSERIFAARREKAERASFVWRLGEAARKVAVRLDRHWWQLPIQFPFVLAFAFFDNMFRPPPDAINNQIEKTHPFYFGDLTKYKNGEIVGVTAGKGHYWDPRDHDPVLVGQVLDRLWMEYCWPVVDSCRDFKTMADRYFPIDLEDFGSGPSLVAAIVQHLAGNSRSAADLLGRIRAECDATLEDMYAAYKDQHGYREFKQMLNSRHQREFITQQYEARKTKKGLVERLADLLSVSLPRSTSE